MRELFGISIIASQFRVRIEGDERTRFGFGSVPWCAPSVKTLKCATSRRSGRCNMRHLLLLLCYQVIQVDSRRDVKNQDDERHQVQNDLHSNTCLRASQPPAAYRQRLLHLPATSSAKTNSLVSVNYICTNVNGRILAPKPHARTVKNRSHGIQGSHPLRTSETPRDELHAKRAPPSKPK